MCPLKRWGGVFWTYSLRNFSFLNSHQKLTTMLAHTWNSSRQESLSTKYEKNHSPSYAVIKVLSVESDKITRQSSTALEDTPFSLTENAQKHWPLTSSKDFSKLENHERQKHFFLLFDKLLPCPCWLCLGFCLTLFGPKSST